MLIDEFLGGYRYFGHWSQIKVWSKEQVINLLEKYAGRDDCGISISTFISDLPVLLFVPFDFDSEEIEDAMDDAFRLYDHFRAGGFTCMLNFTGGKGFHVLLKVKPDLYSKMQLKSFQFLIKKMFRLKTLDQHLFGDLRRLVRIPWTYHHNGRLCFTIEENIGKDYPLKGAIGSCDFAFNGVQPENDFYRSLKPHDYPCVEKIVREDPEPPQLIRFTFVVLRLAEGYKPEEIYEQIKKLGWIDFDPHKTMYQINHIASHQYRPLSCRSLKELGYCLGSVCPYWRKL